MCDPRMSPAFRDQIDGYRRVLSSAIRLLQRHPDRDPIKLLEQYKLQVCGPDKVEGN
jgi:hypothetical protein